MSWTYDDLPKTCREPWRPPEHNSVMVKIDGKFIRCDCRANVFHWIAEDRLACNACGTTYEAIR